MASEKVAARQDNDEEDDDSSEDFPKGDEEIDEKKSTSLTGILNAKIAALAVASLVIGILIGQVALPGLGVGLVSLPSSDGGNGSGNVDLAALQAKVQSYIQKAVESQQAGVSVEVTSIETFNEGFYTVNFDILKDGEVQNSSMVLLTKDGLALVGSQPMMLDEPIPEQPAQQEQQPVEVQKSDKPNVELFVFSYCPYGTQAEKAIAPVVDLLGAKADFSIVQIGAMHGLHEETEAKRQACVLKNYPDKFWDYLVKFDTSSNIGTCNSDAACSAPLVDAIFAQLGIDKAKIESCMPTDGAALYNKDVSYAQGLGIGSSPTVRINGATVNVSRSPEAIKQAVCNAFNTAPSECSTALGATAASAGFGSDAGTASSAGCG